MYWGCDRKATRLVHMRRNETHLARMRRNETRMARTIPIARQTSEFIQIFLHTFLYLLRIVKWVLRIMDSLNSSLSCDRKPQLDKIIKTSASLEEGTCGFPPQRKWKMNQKTVMVSMGQNGQIEIYSYNPLYLMAYRGQQWTVTS